MKGEEAKQEGEEQRCKRISRMGKRGGESTKEKNKRVKEGCT